MLLRKRKNALVETGKPHSGPAQARHRGLQAPAAAPGGGNTPVAAAATVAGAADNPADDSTVAADADLPAAAASASACTSTRKRGGGKKPPVDIGIPQLLLGGGIEPAAAADVIDHLPLGTAGFTTETLQAACDYLCKADNKLVPLIHQHGPPERLLAKRGSNFATLAKTIVFQQLATTAASVIYGRVLAACTCTDALTPEAVLAAPPPALRQAGLSERKVSYIVDLAQHFATSRLSDAKITGLELEALEAELVQVRGIGVWTCHMHAMFHLGAPDVLPTGDLGVRRGMMQLYSLKELPDPASMAQVAEQWRPYRSLGSYFMWKVDAPRTPNKKKRAKPS